MEVLSADVQNFSVYKSESLLHSFSFLDESISTSIASKIEFSPVSSPRILLIQLGILILAGHILFSRLLPSIWRTNSKLESQKLKDPPQMPYTVPIAGNLISYLKDAPGFVASLKQQFGQSSIVRLNFLTKGVYVVSGAEYVNAVWKNTRGLTSTNGINIALSNMFSTPRKDMKFFEADNSGITHDPHPMSTTKADHRVYHLMHKATVDCLSGSHLSIAAQKFQTALAGKIAAAPVTNDWVEMEDLFMFLRPLISYSTIQAMCGPKFLEAFPEFVDDFWYFNSTMPKLLQGWPRWLMPKAWQARDRCIETMKEWRKTCDKENFDGNAMIPQRWKYFSKMEGLSDHGVACSDLGILWGMNSNSMPATFWLMWHMFQDREILGRVSRETESCRKTDADASAAFDTTKLSNNALLQSCYAETLRKYVAVYIIRQPEHEAQQVLDYKIPKGKMMVISSAIAHMDPRNWKTGEKGEYPVNDFWADRFLTYETKSSNTSSEDSDDQTTTAPTAPTPKFSISRHAGSWIPFGGGIHQCPGRHWVKLQMLASFAMINSAFEIETLNGNGNAGLQVDMSKFGLGALQPGEKARFRIRRRT